MANWKYKLEFKEFYHDDNLSIQTKAKMAVETIEKTLRVPLNIDSNRYDAEIDGIKEQFDEIANDPKADVGDFDNVMEQLYDWGDQERAPLKQWPRNAMCWINTQ